MDANLLDRLACPTCIATLDPAPAKSGEAGESLLCGRCGAEYPIVDGIPVFGFSLDDEASKLQELDGELEWVSNANGVKEHVDYAYNSSRHSETIIRGLRASKPPQSGDGTQTQVLDLGAGWGAFQSWQLSKHGYDVVAVELCPEFLLASESVVADSFFERVVADGTLLPFQNGAFDIVLCRELLHHMENPSDALDEIQRVCAPGATIIAYEPCFSVLKDKEKQKEIDAATQHGITHFFYSYFEYRSMLAAVCKDLKTDVAGLIYLDRDSHPVLARSQRLLLSATRNPGPLRRLMEKLFVILLGGSVEFQATAKAVTGREPSQKDRKCIAYDLTKLEQNRQHVEFYRTELVPAVFEIVKDAHRESRAAE